MPAPRPVSRSADSSADEKALRRGGHRVPAVEPARRHQPGRAAGRPARGVRRDRRCARVSPQRLTLASLLAKAPAVIPIPGASRPESIIDSARAPELVLAPDELARLDAG
jgi:aryl-alcohol dehydrogenase-like predicted oxidoreductase